MQMKCFHWKFAEREMLPLTTISAELKGFLQIAFFMQCWCALQLLSPGKMSVNQPCMDSASIQFAGASKSQGLMEQCGTCLTDSLGGMGAGSALPVAPSQCNGLFSLLLAPPQTPGCCSGVLQSCCAPAGKGKFHGRRRTAFAQQGQSGQSIPENQTRSLSNVGCC